MLLKMVYQTSKHYLLHSTVGAATLVVVVAGGEDEAAGPVWQEGFGTRSVEGATPKHSTKN